MATTSTRIGQQAEAQVDRAARRRGWRLVARNYTVRGGELDRVYRDRHALIVVEVRFRSSEAFGGALASVTAKKQRRIVLATRHLLAATPACANCDVRFDVVGVNASGQMDWVENAFYAE